MNTRLSPDANTGPSEGRPPQGDAPLQASDEQFRMLVQGVADYAIYMLDPTGCVRTWNTGAERLKGYSEREIVGRHFSMFFPPEDVRNGKPQRELEIALSNGRYEEEGWRIRKDGSRFWAGVVITSLRSADGTARGFAKVTRDLSERRQAEDRLRASEERFRMMVESVKDYAFFMLDASGYVQSWNAGAARIKGYRADEIIGSHFSKFYPAEEVRDGKPQRELEIAAREGRYEEEGWRLRKNGTFFWASVLITAVVNHEGKLTGFAKVTRDITERRESERVRSIVNNVVDGILTLSELGAIESFNPAAQRMFGYQADEVLGKDFRMLLQEKGYPDAIWDAASHVLDGHHQVIGRRRDGSNFDMELALREFHFLGRRAFTGVVRDVTERLRHEERLRLLAQQLQERNVALQRSNQELDDFAYIASHDLKEPLRGIHNYSHFLMEDYGPVLGEDGRSKLETLARLAQRMENLSDSLLEFSRVGRLDLAVHTADMNEVLNQALAALQITLKLANVEIRVPRPLPRARVDRARTAEVFQNLIANSVKYNDKAQKWVEIGADERDGETVFYVRDNGIGIAEKHFHSIFRIFKRLHARDKYGGGTGAGLTIVKKIIERHGGRIWVESEFGQGTTFYFTVASSEG